MIAETVIPLDEFERKRSKKHRFTRTNTNAIMTTDFEPIRWIVPDFVPEGFSVLAGRQKLGKTWLGIDWAIAVATGGVSMGTIPVEAGNVLYVDMENGPRRIQRRIRVLYPDRVPDLSRLEWVTEAPPLDKGFIDALEDWRQSVDDPRLVVVDVLQRIKPIGNATRNSYENDYSAWAPLQAWAMLNGVAVVGLHHTRKGGADDPLEALSGSNGLSAVADTTLVLDKDSRGITLFVRGRDVEEKESALQFTSGIWTLTGDAGQIRRTGERATILEALHEAGAAMTLADLTDATGMRGGNLRQLLFKMTKGDEVLKSGRGRYLHPEFAPTDNIDNKVTCGE